MVMVKKFDTLNSGNKKEYGNGFVRDTDDNKVRYDLIPRDMLKRLAELYTRGAKLYGDSNWTLAEGDNIECFKRSAFRHFIQWMDEDESEDHGSATVFNIFAYNHLKDGQNKRD